MKGGGLCERGITEVGCMHPTGMYSCVFTLDFLRDVSCNENILVQSKIGKGDHLTILFSDLTFLENERKLQWNIGNAWLQYSVSTKYSSNCSTLHQTFFSLYLFQ